MKLVQSPRLALAVALAIVLASGAHAAPAPAQLTLRNGLRVVLAPDSTAAGADVAVWYPASVRDEGASLSGVRHLLSRLVASAGSTATDETNRRRLVAEGGEVHTALTADYVSEWASVPADAVGLALRFQASRFVRGRLDPVQFEQARKATLADIRARSAASPVSRAVLRLNALVFEGDAYARPVEGDAGAIEKLTAAEVETWRQQHFGPTGAVLTVVGRFDPAATLALVRALFEDLPRSNAPAPAASHATRPVPRHAAESFDTPVNLLVAGWRVPGQDDPDAAAIDLIASVLGPGDSGLMGMEMRRLLGAPVLVQTGIDHHADASMLWAFAGLSGDTTSAETALLGVVDGIVATPIEGSALDRVRAPLVTRLLFQLQTPRAHAQAIGEAVLAGTDPAGASARIESMAKLTPVDLQRVARRIFTQEARSVVLLLPPGGAR